MKIRHTVSAIAMAAGLGLSGQAIANDTMRAPLGSAAGATAMPDRTAAALNAIGKDVVNPSGQNIGEVEDIVADNRTNEIYALISVGGFLGMGDKDIAVPLSSLTVRNQNVLLASQNTVDSLKASPAYDASRYRSLSMNSNGTINADPTQSRGNLVTNPRRTGGDDSDDNSN